MRTTRLLLSSLTMAYKPIVKSFDDKRECSVLKTLLWCNQIATANSRLQIKSSWSTQKSVCVCFVSNIQQYQQLILVTIQAFYIMNDCTFEQDDDKLLVMQTQSASQHLSASSPGQWAKLIEKVLSSMGFLRVSSVTSQYWYSCVDWYFWRTISILILGWKSLSLQGNCQQKLIKPTGRTQIDFSPSIQILLMLDSRPCCVA